MKLEIEEIGVVSDLAFEQAIELFGVDAANGFDFPVQLGWGRSDVDVADVMSRVSVEHPQPDAIVDRGVAAVVLLPAGLPAVVTPFR